MIDRRELLLEILASGVAFKGEMTLTLTFDIKEAAAVPAKVEKPLVKVAKLDVAKTEPRKRARGLSNEQVWDIRDLAKTGLMDSVIAEKLEINVSAVWRVRTNKAYTNVGSRPHDSVTVRAGHGVIKPNGVSSTI